MNLSIIAGRRALDHIRDHGLKQADFRAVVAASGGPKWFVLKGLDQYLFGEFFSERQTPLHTLGSSAGAWQMACFAQDDPAAAVERLADLYSRETYSAKPSPQEISGKARILVKHFLGPDGARQIVDNQRIQTHIITNRCKGPAASETRWMQLGGLITAGAANALSRRNLRHFVDRVIFHSGQHSFFEFDDFATFNVPLTPGNVEDALMASGSIPLILEGVKNIEGAPPGIYRDGGILDYHFDLAFLPAHDSGLVLYPHFSQMITPGWFDKSLRYRRAAMHNYDNVVLLAPSQAFVDRLPHGKIPDRNDFIDMEPDARLRYWQTVISESERLGEELAELVDGGRGLEQVQAFSNSRI
ncbi:patatin-like phospholipase family protein [Allohahella marinimesophila]|uniref:PNPLA domain-containing protein n=1 Tax=Allohahella marinimesophila TaxID=1054972 RepID=A0ABP7NMX2_9GAMM